MPRTLAIVKRLTIFKTQFGEDYSAKILISNKISNANLIKAKAAPLNAARVDIFNCSMVIF
jgi:hypothetical protein